MHLTTDSLNAIPQRQRTALINSLSGYKSANLLGTRSAALQENLAMISSCFHLGADPALLGMIMRPHSVQRHSLEYLQETGVYTLNHVHAEMLTAAHQCAARYPRQISEFAATGLTPDYLDGFAAPFVAESRIRLGLSVAEIQPLKINRTVLVIGRIEHVVLPDAVLAEDGLVDIEKAGSLAVSGLDSYHAGQRLVRFSYAKPDRLPSPLQTRYTSGNPNPRGID
ncbi:MAG: flavin reductase [Alcanivorax sp.]|nr:flavin reductase [Alcanivorax sp.]